MKIFYSLDENKIEPGKPRSMVIALGFFDGVHLAHKEILEITVLKAKENGLKSAVVTFQKSPGGYFDPKKNINIQTLEDRLSSIQKIGLDYCFVLDFSEFQNMNAEKYLKNVLIKNFSPKFIITGFNHTFGAKKEGETRGNSEFLRKNENLGYKYIEIEKRRKDNVLISSTNIKKFLEGAYIKEANSLLGFEFNVTGKVQKGLQLARKIGYKTANIEWPDGIVKIPFGVYSGGVQLGDVQLGGKKYDALINWGIKPTIRPTIGNEKPVLEAHILNFDKEIYEENITVFFKKGIREEKKFDSIDDLKDAIKKDMEIILKA